MLCSSFYETPEENFLLKKTQFVKYEVVCFPMLDIVIDISETEKLRWAKYLIDISSINRVMKKIKIGTADRIYNYANWLINLEF